MQTIKSEPAENITGNAACSWSFQGTQLAHLVVFFLLSLGLMACLTLTPRKLVERWLPGEIANWFVAWSPNIAAAIVIGATAGKRGLAQWLKGWGRWRTHWLW